MSGISALLPTEHVDLFARVADVAGEPVVAWSPARGGYTPAIRGTVRLMSGETRFVKAAVNDKTADWLRMELVMYRALSPKHDFLPRLHHFADDGSDKSVFLVLEDLSAAHWPPPWHVGQVESVLGTLARVHAALTDVPSKSLRSLSETWGTRADWQNVGEDSKPFLSLGFCTKDWLHHALPALIAAEAAVDLSGNDLLHMDVRSDNLCFSGKNNARQAGTSRVVLVDWNWASAGNGQLEIASWLPSLHSEGGPPPEAILPNAPDLAALLAGYWAVRAGLPDVPLAPRVRQIQKIQLRFALPWAARALGLPTPTCADESL